ncbi:hypothetical protein PIB30_108044 [Stylosanthes scabra]|uniref:Uncharacterized protein n=1 Tax=Stylosanthes scabra TaxID=79078 RepID=A0ABU6YZZ4_9FABA|nr:hypothetical protein [Stylosanthes scabra]
MGSGVIYYKYEKREKFQDYDLKADAELGTFKIRHYHFDDDVSRFDPDRPYEVPIKAFMTDQPLSSSNKGKSSARGSHCSRRSSPTPHYSPRRSSSTRRVVSPSLTIVSSSIRRRVAGKTLRPLKSWEFISPSEGWMCEGDEEEKKRRRLEGRNPLLRRKELVKRKKRRKIRKKKKKKTPRKKFLLLLLVT